MSTAIEFKHVCKKFGNFYANKDITFSVKKGEIHALLGENGAGKSTLMNLLFGVYNLDDGEILINGEVVHIKNPNEASKYKIGMVHQHFQLVDTFSVAQNVVLGNEITKGISLDEKTTIKKVQEVIDKYNFDLKATDIVANLTVGQQQKVEILKMLFIDANYLIFDEPSGALTPQETHELLKIMKNLQSQGKTIILITHKLNEIKEVADRCTVIRKGESIKTVDVKTTSNEELANLMVGEAVNFKIDKPNITPGGVKLELKSVSVGNKVKDVSLKLRAGEILGIAGVDGNGQTELVEAIMGFRKVTNGSVIVNGVDMTNKSTRELNDAKIGYVPQDRHEDGLVLDFDLGLNAVLKEYYKQPYSKGQLLDYNAIKDYGHRLIDNFDIRCNDGVDSIVRGMSGGNQQKLIIGREFSQDPEILILVQPTRGVDVGAISNIHKMIMQELEKNKAILLVSLELDEIMQLSDRIAVMHDGEVMGVVNKNETNENEIGLMMAGMRGEGNE